MLSPSIFHTRSVMVTDCLNLWWCPFANRWVLLFDRQRKNAKKKAKRFSWRKFSDYPEIVFWSSCGLQSWKIGWLSLHVIHLYLFLETTKQQQHRLEFYRTHLNNSTSYTIRPINKWYNQSRESSQLQAPVCTILLVNKKLHKHKWQSLDGKKDSRRDDSTWQSQTQVLRRS